MRLGITTFNPLVKIAVWTGWFPTPLLLGYWGMMSSRVLMAAVRLGVFEELTASPRTAEEISDSLGLEPVGTEAILNALNVFTPEQVAAIFAKARAALRPGGTFIVLDSAHKGGQGNIDATGGANELLFWVINDTRAYPEADVIDWMRNTSFTDVRSRHLTLVPQAALTWGRADDVSHRPNGKS